MEINFGFLIEVPTHFDYMSLSYIVCLASVNALHIVFLLIFTQIRSVNYINQVWIVGSISRYH